MSTLACLRLLAFALLAPAGAGCSGDVTPNTTRVLPTPDGVLRPETPAAAAESAAATPAAPAEAPRPLAAAAPPLEPAADAPGKVELTHLSLDAYKAALARPEPGRKFTVVDAWATFCAPCKENFPHLVEMSHAYGSKGVRFVSLTLDDPSEAKAVADAEKFLREQKATFTNVIIDGDPADVYEFLDISAIPAVFVYGPDGKELKRFTLDDPNAQFTYDQVEEYVKGLLAAPPAN